ncbi:MAG: STAS domain-containing protein [Sulfuriflexus sp.]|nr:STAS domain-containing protein [Sulfuriflexus sp.]
MSINVVRKDKEVNISISGRFDFSMNNEFRKILSAPSEVGEQFSIDMGAVEDLDSSALGMLLLLREKAGGDTANIKIQKCREDIIEMLKMANFQTMFDIS